MRKVEVSCEQEGDRTVLGELVHMLTFTSDLAPLNVEEEDARGVTFFTAAGECYAESETNIVVGPICRSVTAENGVIECRPGKHTYRLLLVEVAE